MTDLYTFERHDYADREQLAEGLAIAVAGVLAGGIATRGEAVLAVSGGSTPKRFFEVLSRCEIEWNKVSILPVDERIVPPDHGRSNARLIRDHLMQNKAQAAHLIAFETTEATPEACAERSEALMEHVANHIDALVLGMGTDGHTASFFPGGDRLADALDLNGDASVLPMRAEGAGEPRLTLTLPVVLSARFLALHIEGDEKQSVFRNACAGIETNEMPIRAVLTHARAPLRIFWAP